MATSGDEGTAERENKKKNSEKNAELRGLEEQNQHLCKRSEELAPHTHTHTATQTHTCTQPYGEFCCSAVTNIFHIRMSYWAESALGTATPCCAVKLLHGLTELD